MLVVAVPNGDTINNINTLLFQICLCFHANLFANNITLLDNNKNKKICLYFVLYVICNEHTADV